MNEDFALDHDTDIDPAAEAFARLEGEIALMRRAVEHLAVERADIVIPDYGATLTEMAKQLGAISRSLATIADHPAMRLTPDSLAARIEAVGLSARRADHDRIIEARTELHHAAREMRAVVVHARTAAEQRRRLIQAAGGGVLAGILLTAFLAGPIVRAMPKSWHWPERMAANIIGLPMAQAAKRLISSADPEPWVDFLDAYQSWRTNDKSISRYIQQADRTRQYTECLVDVGRRHHDR